MNVDLSRLISCWRFTQNSNGFLTFFHSYLFQNSFHILQWKKLDYELTVERWKIKIDLYHLIAFVFFFKVGTDTTIKWKGKSGRRPVGAWPTTTTLIRAHKRQLRKPIKMRDLRVINRRHSKDNWRLLMMVATDARNKPDPVALLMTAIFLNA